MSRPSKTYRIYCFDIDRNAVSADFVNATSDEEAISRTQETGFGSKCEIWDGKRLVAQLEKPRRQA
jgi:hypothetical protein